MKLDSILKNKEVKNAGWLIGGKVAQMGLSLFISIITARYLGPGNYGLISYGTAFVSFFTALCTLGINSVIIKDFVDHPNDQGKAIGSALVLRIISSSLSALMIFGIVSIIDRDEPTTVAVVVLCSFGGIFNVFETFNYWFQNQYKSKITSLATLSAYSVMSLYKIVLLITGKDVRWFAFAASVDYIIVALFLYVAYRKYNGPKLIFSAEKSKSLLKTSYHYILSTMMIAIYGQTDKIMLKHMSGKAEVGYYSTAVAICAMWTFVLQAIIDSVYPTILKLKGENKELYERKNRQLYLMVFYISGFVSVFFLIFGGLIVRILYGRSFLPAADVLKVVTWYTAFSYLGVARNAWIVSENCQKYLKYMYGGAAVLNIVLNYFFIQINGAIGAAAASLITQVFTSMILPVFFPEMRANVKLMLEAITFRKVK